MRQEKLRGQKLNIEIKLLLEKMIEKEIEGLTEKE